MKRILGLGLWLGAVILAWGILSGGSLGGGVMLGAEMAPAIAAELPSALPVVLLPEALPDTVASTRPEPAADLAPATLFAQNCAACHAGGGNIIRRGKTLQLKALARNQVDSPAAIAQLITQGKGNMSAYGDRLSPQQIDALADYVLAQAEVNWK